MTHREPDSLIESDPHDLLFGPDDEGDDGDYSAPSARQRPSPRPGSRASAERARRKQRRRSRRAVLVGALVVLVVIAVTAAIVVPKISDWIHPPDYSGAAGKPAQVVVAQGESAAEIAKTLHGAGVVKSEKAFTEAAKDNSRSEGIQPGTYAIPTHISGVAAVDALLDPANRLAGHDLAITEGASLVAIEDRLLKIVGNDRKAEVQQAFKDPAALGLPTNFVTSAGKPPASAEGFLFPATYTVGPKDSVNDVLTKAVAAFADQARTSGFSAAAGKAGLTPYTALVIASIAQAEAKYPEDMPKVVRVILNRIKAQRPLQVDATTVYGAELNGKSKNQINVASYPSPYNSYLHAGLPPTPISSPGPDALDAAVHPAAGNWMYYVNGSDDGHLTFTVTEADFAKARQKCIDNKWGCG